MKGSAFTLEGGEGSSLNTVVSPFSMLRPQKARLGGVSYRLGGGGGGGLLPTINVSVFQGAIGAMVDQFITLGDVLDGWLGNKANQMPFSFKL